MAARFERKGIADFKGMKEISQIIFCKAENENAVYRSLHFY